jgi:hypothetical protein
MVFLPQRQSIVVTLGPHGRNEMEAILSMLGAVMLILVSLAAVLGLVILVLHETRYIIRLSTRLSPCATHAAQRQEA